MTQNTLTIFKGSDAGSYKLRFWIYLYYFFKSIYEITNSFFYIKEKKRRETEKHNIIIMTRLLYNNWNETKIFVFVLKELSQLDEKEENVQTNKKQLRRDHLGRPNARILLIKKTFWNTHGKSIWKYSWRYTIGLFR